MLQLAQRRTKDKSSHVVRSARTGRMASCSHPVDTPLLAQQALGNQAMQRLLRAGVIQAKLTVNEPGDQYEQEADRVAETVMRIPDPSTADRAAVDRHSPGVHIQRMCPECEEELHRQPMEEKEDEAQALQAKEVPGRTPEVTPDVQAQINTTRGGGQPLPESVRAFFEPRFGYDFSRVRIHTDALAAESARAVSARAYTVGQDVVFGIGQYAPNSVEGRRLLAHELTHVVQQRSVSNYSEYLSVSETGNRAEREADVATQALEQAQNDQLGITSSRGPVLVRQTDLEEPGLAPGDFATTQPTSSVFPCNPENDEGFPLVCGKTPSTRARDAVGFAQKQLKFVHEERISPCIDNVFCRSAIPLETREFMAEQLKKLSECGLPFVVDCKCGPCTEAATKLFQAFVFVDDPREWDGIIGPKTWKQLNFMATNPPIPLRPRPFFL